MKFLHTPCAVLLTVGLARAQEPTSLPDLDAQRLAVHGKATGAVGLGMLGLGGFLLVGGTHAFAELSIWQPGMSPPDCEGMVPACDRNTAPVFGAPWMFLNGAWVDLATPIHAGDRVGIAYPFADTECNVTCGSYIASANTPDAAEDTGGSLEEMPCATGPSIGLEFSQVDNPGLYEYSLRLFDACGAEGELAGDVRGPAVARRRKVNKKTVGQCESALQTVTHPR